MIQLAPQVINAIAQAAQAVQAVHAFKVHHQNAILAAKLALRAWKASR
jgi:hypothetical protein